MKKILLYTTGIVIGIFISQGWGLMSEKEPKTKQVSLQEFYSKTQSEIANSQKSIQKVMDKHGEQAGMAIIKDIVFKNFCEIPGVIDTAVTTKVVIK